MLPATFARLRNRIGVLVLLAVFASLLPAQQAAAQSEPDHIEITVEELNEITYQNWLTSFPDLKGAPLARRIEQDVLQGIVAQRLFDNRKPVRDTDELFKQATVLQQRYIQQLGSGAGDPVARGNLPPQVVAEAMLTAALQTPEFKESATSYYEELRAHSSSIADYVSDDDRAYYKTFADSNLLLDATRKLKQEQAGKVLRRARTDPKFAKAWDKHFPQGDLKLEGFDAKTFAAAHPEAPIPPAILNAIPSEGTMQISLADLEQLAKSEFAKINASIDDIQTTLGEISKQQGELVDFMRNEQKRQQAQALAEAKAKEHQLRIQAAGASVSIISNLIGIADPEAGKQFATIGNAAVTVGDSLSKWLDAVAGLNGLDKLTSLSTVVMTGNVLGAVMSVVSLFGEQQPSPEQLILEEIGKLRQQVNELRTEMHDRFDRVDAQLNTIYTTMHERFNQIDIQLGKINGKLDDIQQSLLTLGLALDRLERNNLEYLDALGRRPLREAMNGALGYKQRTGREMLFQPTFVDYENTFHTWATINAFDALSAGATERDYSDAAVLRELNSAPLDANLNYLNGWLLAHGLQPFSTKRLPGLRDWTFASRAYAELGFDWPAHLKQIDPQRQAALDAVGADLAQAMQNITTIQTSSGPQANAPLFTALTSNYTSKLAALESALVASEQTFVKDVQTGLGRPTGFDLFGGMDQLLGLAYLPADFIAISCGVGGQERLAAPQYLKYLISGRFALAEYLQVRPLKVCVSYEWINEAEQCSSPQVCEIYANPRVTLSVYSNNAELLRRTVGGYRQKKGDIRAVVLRDWDLDLKAKFESIFVGVSSPLPLSPAGEAELATLSDALANKLAELQRGHASRVLTELNSGSLRAKAVELGGAKKLLESFVTLGFSQALASDDFLRSLLFSEEALVDDQQVALAYSSQVSATLSATQAISEAQLLVNPRIGLQKAGTKRREALSGLLTDYLGNISTENYREDNAMVASARFDMQLARVFAELDVPSPTPEPTPGPGQNQAVFLPLLRR